MSIETLPTPIPYAQWLQEISLASSCCVGFVMRHHKCPTEDCLHSATVTGLLWHGLGEPSRESVIRITDKDFERCWGRCPECGMPWLATPQEEFYLDRIHAMMRGELLPAEFDEEAERARLMPV